MSEPRVRLYTTPWCPYCIAARRLLRRLDIAFDDVDVSGDRARRDAIVRETGWPTVPVVLIDGELVGGYSELSALHARGGLEPLLPAA